jgi:hypothetical protein
VPPAAFVQLGEDDIHQRVHRGAQRRRQPVEEVVDGDTADHDCRCTEAYQLGECVTQPVEQLLLVAVEQALGAVRKARIRQQYHPRQVLLVIHRGQSVYGPHELGRRQRPEPTDHTDQLRARHTHRLARASNATTSTSTATSLPDYQEVVSPAETAPRCDHGLGEDTARPALMVAIWPEKGSLDSYITGARELTPGEDAELRRWEATR